MTCKICGCENEKVIYSGAIRDAKWGTFLDPVEILECEQCGVQRLPERLQKTSEFYASGEYDRKVREPVTDMRPYNRHLDILLDKCKDNRIEADRIFDIGGGEGYFSKAVKRHWSSLYAISMDIGDDITGLEPPDIITSFNVIEHVEDPLQFMKEAYNLLPFGGEILICTPNRDNILMYIADNFPQFYYRTQHNWYFDGASLLELAFRAGFSDCSLAFSQNYGINNTMGWIVQGKPSKDYQLPVENTSEVDASWENLMIDNGLADTVYVYGRKP